MIDRLNCVHGNFKDYKDHEEYHPTMDYFNCGHEENLLPYPLLLYPFASTREHELCDAMGQLAMAGQDICISEEHVSMVTNIINRNAKIFRLAISLPPPAQVDPLKIELTINVTTSALTAGGI